MEPGTKVKIVNCSGLFPEELMGRDGVVIIEHEHNNRILVNVDGEGDIWMYNYRLEEIKDEQEKEVR